MILDTNILSELMRPAPDPNVTAWANRQTGRVLFSTAISEAEIRYGLNRLPDGQRKLLMTERFDQALEERLILILPFGSDAARAYGDLASNLANKGQIASMADLMIASIALIAGQPLVTRYVSDFQNTGLTVINPFEP